MAERDVTYRLAVDDTGQAAAFDQVAESAGTAEEAVIDYGTANEAVGDQSDKTTKAIQDQIAKIDRLIERYKDDARFTKALETKKRRLTEELKAGTEVAENYGEAVDKNAVSMHGLSGLAEGAITNFGDLSGFLQGSADDLAEVTSGMLTTLASSTSLKGGLAALGGALMSPVGLTAALTAVNALLGAYVKKQEEAEEAAKKTADEAARAVASLLELSDNPKEGTFQATLDELKEVRDGTSDFVDGLRDSLEELEQIRVAIIAGGTSAPEGFGALFESRKAQLREEEAVLAGINQVIEERGKNEEANSRLREKGLEFAEEEEKSATGEKTLIEQALAARMKLQQHMAMLATEEGERLVQLRLEVEELTEAAKIRERLIRLRQQDLLRIPTSEFGALQTAGTQLGTERGITFGEVDEGKKAEQVGVSIRNMSEAGVRDVERLRREGFQALRDEMSETVSAAESMEDVLKNGVVDGLTVVGDAVFDIMTGQDGALKQLGVSMLSTVANLGEAIGTEMIAFGTAGLALKAFRLNPGAAIVAGLALRGISRALNRTVDKMVEDDSGGGSGGGSGFSGNTNFFSGVRTATPVGSADLGGTTRAEPISIEPIPPVVLANGDLLLAWRRAGENDTQLGGRGLG